MRRLTRAVCCVSTVLTVRCLLTVGSPLAYRAAAGPHNATNGIPFGFPKWICGSGEPDGPGHAKGGKTNASGVVFLIPLAHPHVRPMGVRRACRGANEIELNATLKTFNESSQAACGARGHRDGDRVRDGGGVTAARPRAAAALPQNDHGLLLALQPDGGYCHHYYAARAVGALAGRV